MATNDIADQIIERLADLDDLPRGVAIQAVHMAAGRSADDVTEDDLVSRSVEMLDTKFGVYVSLTTELWENLATPGRAALTRAA